MTVHLFFNPDLVGQLAACGITARRPAQPDRPARGFVLDGRRVPPRARETVTNVISQQGHLTITGPRQLADRPRLALPATTSTEPQTALELIEENARLRRDNQRLVDEAGRLRTEIARLTGATSRNETVELDDTTTRFSLLELD